MITIKGKHSVLEALLSDVKISDITIFDVNPTGDLKKILLVKPIEKVMENPEKIIKSLGDG